EVRRMLPGQPRIDRPGQHPPGPVPKLLHLGEGGFPRWSCRSKAMPRQQYHQFAELFFLLRRQFQILTSSVLAHRRFLSKGSNLPKYLPNLTSLRQIHHPSSQPPSDAPKSVPAPQVSVPPELTLTG